MKDVTINAISDEELRINAEMSTMNPGSEEYLNAARAMKTLAETKTEEKKSKISVKVIVEGGIKILAGLGLIFLSSSHILDDKIERISDRIVPKDR